MEKRVCKTCTYLNPLTNFRSHFRNGKWYWEYQCIKCTAAKRSRHRADNPDVYREIDRIAYQKDAKKINAKALAWYYANKSRHAETYARWRAKNRSKDQAAARRWRASHLDHSRLLSKKRRAKVQGVRVETVTKKDIQEMKSRQRGLCAICVSVLEKFHIDHIMPLSLGGEHAKRNLQLLCQSCNLSKSSKHPVDFMRARGFLL